MTPSSLFLIPTCSSVSFRVKGGAVRGVLYRSVYFRAADGGPAVSGRAVVGLRVKRKSCTLLLHALYMRGYPMGRCNNGGRVVRVRKLLFDTHSEHSGVRNPAQRHLQQCPTNVPGRLRSAWSDQGEHGGAGQVRFGCSVFILSSTFFRYFVTYSSCVYLHVQIFIFQGFWATDYSFPSPSNANSCALTVLTLSS